MAKLTDAHKEQCRSMAKDGKRPCEIIDFFKTTYHIDIKSPTLNYIIHGRKVQGVASAEGARRKVANDKYLAKKFGRSKAAAQPTGTETNDFVAHIHAAWNIHKKDFVAKVEEVLAKI